MSKAKLWGVQRLPIIVGGVGVGILTILGAVCMAHSKHQGSLDAKTHAAQVIQEVGKIYELPSDEKPTVLRISNAAKLKSQPFFDKAENGDYALLYTDHKFGILY